MFFKNCIASVEINHKLTNKNRRNLRTNWLINIKIKVKLIDLTIPQRLKQGFEKNLDIIIQLLNNYYSAFNSIENDYRM